MPYTIRATKKTTAVIDGVERRFPKGVVVGTRGYQGRRLVDDPDKPFEVVDGNVAWVSVESLEAVE